MIDTRPRPDRVILVGAPRRGSRDAKEIEDHLDELSSLADTAGAQVVGRLTQRVAAPASNYYIGAGKVEEVRAAAEAADASVILFDEELSPAQGKNLEEALGRRVMDRAELILDIFATRARTREARMQVELAQLEYLLPRLARMWVHLSRIRGGIGLRGPGETQLETDRRMIRRKISGLRKKLEDVTKHREIIRRGRKDVLTAVLVGYTNAGKSSLLRTLTGAETLVENRLFATLDTLTREVSLNGREGKREDEGRGKSEAGKGEKGNGKSVAESPSAHSPVSPSAHRVRLIDTVGFIRKLPHQLVASFRATLEEVRMADVLLHVIDASHPEWESQVNVVNETLAELGAADRPVIYVFNKMDLVEAPDAFRAMVLARFDRAVFVSAERGDAGELVDALRAAAHPV
jgi:GTP-binding protein HflX